MADQIVIRGAREHNLKNIDLVIPRNKLVVITGLSGSGKSSLAFDTVYAEGQRRYVESLSSYARQFLGIMEKPDVDQIDGLSPAISIDQKSSSRNPRSTVATVTEIYDYLRLLFARIGVPHCPIDQSPVFKKSKEDIISEISVSYLDQKILILAPIVEDKKGAFEHIPSQYSKAGYGRALVDGTIYELDEFPDLDKNIRHNIFIVIDRIVVLENDSLRLSQAIEQALSFSENQIAIMDYDQNKIEKFSLLYGCLKHPEIKIPELEPRSFSFNSPQGACPVCTGLGYRQEIDPELVIPNGNLTLAEGAIRPYNRIRPDLWYLKKLEALANKYKFSLHQELSEISPENIKRILFGTAEEKYPISIGRDRVVEVKYNGVINDLQKRYNETESDFIRKDIEKYMHQKPCHACLGLRLRPEVLAVKINQKSIMDICQMDIEEALDWFVNLKLSDKELNIGSQILKEIDARLNFLIDVGLNYLTLLRSANTLSGGEAQRIRLATQIGSGLMGVLYVLDEPSIGLHQRDNQKLIKTLKHLRDLGNSVIVVEHDEDTIRTADYLIDIGPGAGIHGGHVVAFGTPQEVEKENKSITAKYLTREKKIPIPQKRRTGNNKTIQIIGASQNNLKNINVSIPLNELVVVTGVSGSGKSSLINDILARELLVQLHRASLVPGKFKDILGVKNLDKAIIIDQEAIGRTPRSNPATYTGLFTPIRELFASVPEAKIRGYNPGRFSFNVVGGRCENCKGDGIIKIEMHFLPDVYVSCEVCHGRRYNKEALEILYKAKNISQILDMTIEQALAFFENIPIISRKLQTLQDVGLGYIKLGQPATTLSGGEAQRVKLSTELSRRPTGRTLYILDEPTTGLHFEDVSRLIRILHQLVDAGNSVIVIEHNLDVIKNADHIIDIGPDGGNSGGQIVAQGTPEQIINQNSYTAQFLKSHLI